MKNEDMLDAVRYALNKASQQKIIETGIARSEAEALIFRLRGFEQSSVDPQLWNLWGKK